MGLEPDARGADVKKRYMRLSLLIHPDKCSHPQAQRAFQAVSKASKQLQVSLSSRDQRSSWPIVSS
jgi:curved DNA-binding protein CbpA